MGCEGRGIPCSEDTTVRYVRLAVSFGKLRALLVVENYTIRFVVESSTVLAECAWVVATVLCLTFSCEPY